MRTKSKQKLYRVYYRLCVFDEEAGTLTKGRQKTANIYAQSADLAFYTFIEKYPLPEKLAHYEIQVTIVDKNAYEPLCAAPGANCALT